MRLTVLALLLASPVFGGQSNSLLDVTPDGKRLLVANTDNDTVTVVDTATRKKLKEFPVGDHPEGVSWVGNGPTALVTLYCEDAVAFIDAEAGKIVAKIDKVVEPYGVVASRDGKRAYVSQDYPGTVAEIDVEGRKLLRTIPAGPWSRGLALSNNESRLYVSNFFTADLTAIDIATGKVVDTWEGNGQDNLARNVALHPNRDKAYLPGLRARTNVFDSDGSITPYLSICHLWAKRSPDEKRRSSVKMDTFNGVHVVSNPWEAALSPDGKLFFLFYAGTDEMNVCKVVDDDYVEIDRIGRTVDTGKHPRAAKVSPDNLFLYVYATLDFAVNVYSLPNAKKVDSIKVCDPPHTPEWVRGKELFQSSAGAMSRRRWVACASCHPDGAQDQRVWRNPEGLRRTPPLFGLAHTHPLHWSGDRDEVQDFEYTIRGKLMKGRGLAPNASLKPRNDFLPASELEQVTSGLSKDLDALAVYTNSFQPRLSPHPFGEEAKRGKELFFSKAVGCAECHTGPYYTDSSLKKPFKLHDVGTGNDDPLEKMGPRYDTPTLLGVYRSAPYLHHGKAETLMDVLTTFNPKDQHGKTSHLSGKEKEELVAFLKALPYEKPPEETPNTVPHRLIEKRGDDR